MSIVLRGIGIAEIDSGSSVVAFGLARDLAAGESIIDALENADISQLFVVDFDGRRKMTKHEHRKYKRLTKMMRGGLVTYAAAPEGFRVKKHVIPRKVAA